MGVKAKLLRTDQYLRGYAIYEDGPNARIMFKDAEVRRFISPTIEQLRDYVDMLWNRIMSGVEVGTW